MVKPHKPVSASTVGRWIKETLKAAGINTATYKAHSTRSASTSKAALAGIPTDAILKFADWSNAQTFRRFYQRNPEGAETMDITDATEAFASTVLTLDRDRSPSDTI